ncbi:Sensor histidine kinase TmoS [Acaryochloris thomasi RCC1774]|uniref:histidine kinase n=1 Tax=Acaryochloris thomasi RCC1774 TaxID=1764569 RepID=A0A2W1JI14_9CYAN|nr:response regulator [Acaryochloris thomasi]PZD73170.1 Sensor histidine kinase TmoS [Acaryochloris thomasi RCC1774]
MTVPVPTADILVVDDTPANLRLLMKLLTDQGYGVRPVAEGALALTAAQLVPPDLILLDIKMPGMDGYEVCRQLKADARTREVPVIFLTVLDEAVDIVKGFALGGVDYITKPVRAGELMARINSQVQLRFLQKQLAEKNQVQEYLLEQYETTALALKESEEKFSKAFERSPVPLSLAALPAGHFLDVNQEFVIQTGYSRQEILGHTVLELDFWVDLSERSQLLERLQIQGSVHDFETRLRAKSGEIRDVLMSVEIINLNNNPHFLAAVKDVTERNVAERRLAARTKELSQALETLKDAQNQLVESAKMAALGNLVAGVAHEINTPVGTAIMMASTLENATRMIAKDTAQGRLTQSAFHDYLEVATDASQLILDNLKRAGDLVQSFKQVAVDQTSLRERTFKVKPYLQEVISNLHPQLKQTPHSVTIAGDATLTLHSHPGALSQIITNLVVNSIDHGFCDNRAGQIHIDIQQRDAQCLLTYSDNGIGIQPENLERIFEPFFTTTHHKGGSGLGLHLVYNLVTQSLQGLITVTSTVGSGTTFTITMPQKLKDKKQ